MTKNKIPYHTECVSYPKDHFKAIKKNGKKTEMYQTLLKGGGRYPPFGKKPNYFRFFLVKASLRRSGLPLFLTVYSWSLISTVYAKIHNPE